ncbi:uncharacterized protein LOC124193067 [Daphnia pulex]|uniref:uncharacterized protein LOC124193062 n=1 Tax=Daphnia pulex TaxID=6669 RepID=UPI001EDDB221|nr:uncharacterized protein LOC124193062 [Daphnia pulex]XP_046442676.1 uncharacterized protein LOC124193067 [Daphnia pulex]
MPLTFEGHRDHYVKRVMQWCRDPSPATSTCGTSFLVLSARRSRRSLSNTYHATAERLGEKGERKGQRHQSSEDLRHGNNCSALSVTICLLQRIASSYPWLIRRRTLFGVVSLFGGSTTGVSMSSWYGGYQTATPPPSQKQLTQRPVIAPRSTSTTLLRHRSFIP